MANNKTQIIKHKWEWLTFPLKGGKSVLPHRYLLPVLGGQFLQGCLLAAPYSWVLLLAGSLCNASLGIASHCLIKSQQPFPLALSYIKHCRVCLYP